jgi:hypothetical protein
MAPDDPGDEQEPVEDQTLGRRLGRHHAVDEETPDGGSHPVEGMLSEPHHRVRGHYHSTRKVWKGYRVEALVYLGVAFFFALVCAAYWFTSYEHAGSVMLVLTAFLGFLPGAYLFWWGQHMPPRAEDAEGAELEDGAGTVGAFPSSSIWPFVMGVGAAFTALAFVFGPWWGVLGGALVVGTLVGYTLESRRGGYV